jgi:hypothetical protein
MVRNKNIDQFISITLYPSGNTHFTRALANYKGHLNAIGQGSVCGCTFEQFIDCLQGNAEILNWKQYLTDRYLVALSA